MTKKTKKSLPKGFKCLKCGAEHQFHAYVYAHWNDFLVFTCPECKHEHRVFRGKVSEL